MPFLLGSAGLLVFGLLYVGVFAFSAQGLSPEHALVGLVALFFAALLPCLAHALEVWRHVNSRGREADPALLSLRRDLDLLFRTQEEQAQRVHLSLVRLEAELSPPATPAPSPDLSALVEETVRQHLARSPATDPAVSQSLVRLDTSVKHLDTSVRHLDTSVKQLNRRVEQLEFRFGEPAPAEPAQDPFLQNLSTASALPAADSEPAPAPPSPLLSRALGAGQAHSGHVSRLIAGGIRQPSPDKTVATPADSPGS